MVLLLCRNVRNPPSGARMALICRGSLAISRAPFRTSSGSSSTAPMPNFFTSPGVFPSTSFPPFEPLPSKESLFPKIGTDSSTETRLPALPSSPCMCTSVAYAPFCLISDSWLPRSITAPSFTTAITSALRIVDRRCATTTVVRPTIRRSNASCTTRSLSASSALVASSRRRIFGSFTMARAIATRCF
mmetsp:Transcript_7569/g.20628  ORF Transcript_7569/g.20628 Transcript_7569/m.20628 type:complete len:188 (-) Transcript_7569:2064-2627(-)